MMAFVGSPLAGIVVGFLGAVPVGPLNIAVMTDGLRGKGRTALALVIGGTLGDFLYCGVAMLGLSQLLVDTLQSLALRLVFGIGIVAYGIFILLRSNVRLEGAAAPPRFGQVHNSFWIGLLLTLLNPSLLATWALTGGALHAWGIIGPGVGENLLFAAGAGVGMAAWLSLLLFLFLKHRRRIPEGFVRAIVIGFGVVLIGFGVFCMVGLGLEK